MLRCGKSHPIVQIQCIFRWFLKILTVTHIVIGSNICCEKMQPQRIHIRQWNANLIWCGKARHIQVIVHGVFAHQMQQIDPFGFTNETTVMRLTVIVCIVMQRVWSVVGVEYFQGTTIYSAHRATYSFSQCRSMPV